jgi:hypothetical protein
MKNSLSFHLTKMKKLWLVIAIFFCLSGSGWCYYWPPQEGMTFPEVEWIDQNGDKVKVSDFKGKMILIEYVGMNCPACQAFAGAAKWGKYEGIAPQGGLESIEKYFPLYAKGINLSDERIVYIQILLYSMTMQAPTAEDAQKWAKHFHMDRSKNRIVVAGKPELIGDGSYNLIPGFQILDKELIIRSDSTGHNPKRDLWTHLLPMVPELLRE